MKQEPMIRADFYRALTNSISRGMWGQAIYGEMIKGHKISKIAVEYPVNGKKADLVVFRQLKQGKDNYPFLVIETKGRRIYPALSLARACKQAMNYAKKLNSNFFAVYDGWNFLLFEIKYPYLIKVSNFLQVDDYIARDILSGLLEFEQYRHEAQSLKKLPKVPDGWSFHQTIMPSIAKILASVTKPDVEGYWRILLNQWFSIIKEDGKW